MQQIVKNFIEEQERIESLKHIYDNEDCKYTMNYHECERCKFKKMENMGEFIFRYSGSASKEYIKKITKNYLTTNVAKHKNDLDFYISLTDEDTIIIFLKKYGNNLSKSIIKEMEWRPRLKPTDKMRESLARDLKRLVPIEELYLLF